MFFAGLWNFADKAGRLENRPRRLKIEIFPYDNVDVEKCIKMLSKSKNGSNKPFIQEYEIDNCKYIQIINWEKHQRPHHTEKDSIIPPTPPLRKREKEKGKGMEKGMEKQLEASAELDNGVIPVKNTLKEKELKERFEKFREKYPGTKRGLDTEYDYLKQVCKTNKLSIAEIIPLLENTIIKQIEVKNSLIKNGQFCADWKNLKTWLYNKCWEEEIGKGIKSTQPTVKNNNHINFPKAFAGWKMTDKKGKDNLGHIIEQYSRWNSNKHETVWYCSQCDKQFEDKSVKELKQ